MDKKRSDDKQDNKRFNKFNSFWIYGLIALILLASQLFFDSTFSSNEPISFNDFAQFVQQGDVKSVEVINAKYANVFIKSLD